MTDQQRLIDETRSNVGESIGALITARLLAFHDKLVRDYGLTRVNFDDEHGRTTTDGRVHGHGGGPGIEG